jgi:alkanesulfonate monooxygenase SsuD/methylene tetrahydromethanopterin reductase-like flavin-dependent oxidoreductase (luciferase family)
VARCTVPPKLRHIDVALPSPKDRLLVAAMAPRTLAAAGEFADGTMTFLASPEVIAEHITPVITAAAEAAEMAVTLAGSGDS